MRTTHGPAERCLDPWCPLCRTEKDLFIDETLGMFKAGAISSSRARERLGLPRTPLVDHAGGNVHNWCKINAFDRPIGRVTEVRRPADGIEVAATLFPHNFQEYLKSKENNDMASYTIDIDLSSYFNGTTNSSKPSSPTPEQSFLSAVRDFAKDDPNLAKKIKEAAEKAEREHKEGIEKALKGVNFLAMKEGHSGRDFCVSFWKDGEAHSLDGTDYAYGEHIKKDEEDDELRVFVSGGIYPMSCSYYTMDNLRKHLEGRGILYVIEYYPDQD